MSNSKTIYMIGNGFDLHHFLPTSYHDYKKYLDSIDHELVLNIDKILKEYGHSDYEIERWSLLEEYLGEFHDMDYEELYCEAFDGSETDSERASYWHEPGFNAEELTSDKKKIMLGIKEHFNGWVDSFSITKNCKGKRMNLIRNSTYISFNYSKTLEIVYGVSSKNILYIHNRTKNDYILGHNCARSLPYPVPNDYSYDEETDEENFDDDCRSIDVKEKLNDVYSEIFNTYYKNSKKIIETNAAWFKKINNCKKIIIMGLSLGKEDTIYLDYISNNARKLRNVVIYYHSQRDYQHYLDVGKKYFSKVSFELIKW